MEERGFRVSVYDREGTRDKALLVRIANSYVNYYGETNARIANRLVVTEDTVKTHVKHILRKLGVQNRSQAVCRYFQIRGAIAEPRPAASAAGR